MCMSTVGGAATMQLKAAQVAHAYVRRLMHCPAATRLPMEHCLSCSHLVQPRWPKKDICPLSGL